MVGDGSRLSASEKASWLSHHQSRLKRLNVGKISVEFKESRYEESRPNTLYSALAPRAVCCAIRRYMYGVHLSASA